MVRRGAVAGGTVPGALGAVMCRNPRWGPIHLLRLLLCDSVFLPVSGSVQRVPFLAGRRLGEDLSVTRSRVSLHVGTLLAVLSPGLEAGAGALHSVGRA